MSETRNALVTGASQGIGLAIARQLGRAGFNVVLSDVGSATGLDEGAEAIAREFDVKAVGVAADLTDDNAISDLLTTATHLIGELNVLVNNAAAARRPAGVVDTTPTEWRETIAVNLDAPFLLSRALLPAMIDKGWGRIVNVSSVFGLVGTANRPGYVATKHALIGLTRAISAETLGTGVTCNAVCPGLTMTSRQQRDIEQISAQQGVSLDEAERILAKRLRADGFLSPDSTAAAVAYFCSDAAAEVTGLAMAIDGGQSAMR